MAPASSERALVLGYGSIGERHSRVLSALGLDVAVVSRRDLGDVTCDNGTRTKAQTRQKHLHLRRRRVLSFVENHERVVERSTTHKRQRCNFDRIALHQRTNAFHIEHVVQCIVQRT